MSFHIYALLAVALAYGLYKLYKAALPKPVPGIPCDNVSRNRLMGDLPDAMKWMNERKEFWSFMQERCIQLNSPIVQVWMQPLGRPFIVISDYLESQDIMVRKTPQQFDRSAWLGDMFWAIAPRNMTRFLTNDDWKVHRRLMADAMSPKFLKDVASHHGHSGASSLVALWKSKMELAQGHAFSVLEDVCKAGMDTMWASTLGDDISTTSSQVDLISSLKSVELPASKDIAVEFPEAKDPEAFTALLELGDSVVYAASSPFPKITHWLAVHLISSLRKSMRLKGELFSGLLNSAARKFATSQDESRVKHVLDLVVQREVSLAKKEGRTPAFDTQDIRDELFGFLLAGNETTAATICWGVKHLADNQEVQDKLRKHLREAHGTARENGMAPTSQEIVTANIPYLEATITEILRLAGSTPGNSRRTTQNVQILGYDIPKGYDVLMLSNGADYISAPLPIDPNRRSKRSVEANDVTGMWDPSNISDFMPERWLATDEKGEVTYNAKAGPFQAFGAGLRGCYGRKLAELNLRQFFTLILWEYKVLPPPDAYRSYIGLDKAMHQPQQCYLRLEKAS
ncbi:hypothetical protein DOTSEDRAFT_140271 [Dothistroma septosporum NZE10]|uniref:Cytochrome P450 monooxygenase-like protein n=1 Tax=Dothistroma septosporum (strain NZE10 / CBS 128990) TaxID=675120 RepID=M2WIV0_DOTSN|nr:hypothetical protein DOTSEDRAFT_140271 [Dothistroma septosporum NZE10]